jgi:hypothetical protein
MTDLGVVYLYRYCEGEAPVHLFLEGFRCFPAGAPHQLHVVLKGFPDRRSVDKARALFEGTSINSIEVDDLGYDIGSYLKAARQVSNRRLFFLNTFSVIQAANWLAHFSKALDQPRIGIVGATGSWQARPAGYEVQALLILNRAKRIATGLFGRGDTPDYGHPAPRPITSIRQLARYACAPMTYLNALRTYTRFPNPHIRTNAFMIERDLFLSLKFPPLTTKEQAYQFESGRRSMTNQIISRGLRPVVVGRDGETFDVEEWPRSSTFWKNRQENLLVSDNRTRDYAEATVEFKTLLENLAWRHPRSWQYPVSWQNA